MIRSLVRTTALVAVVAALPGCPADHVTSTTDTGATTSEPVDSASTTTAATDMTTTDEDTAGSSSGSGGPPGLKCSEEPVSGAAQTCAPDEVCIEGFGGDFCYLNSGVCAPLPEGCTHDDLCAPACAGLCDNYNCPIPLPEFCESENGRTCDYDCGSQATCRIEGTACKAIAHDSSGWFNHHCVPTPDPQAQIGEACARQGDGEWQWDNCEPGALCWPIDPDTMQGTCRSECGLADSPPCESCLALVDNGFLTPIAVCTVGCDPLAPDCPAGEVCAPILQHRDPFVCMPDASADAGELFDPCKESSDCDPDLMCVGIDSAPIDCDPMKRGCCLPFCIATQPQCPGGTTCDPFYSPGQGPPGLEDLGVCRTP